MVAPATGGFGLGLAGATAAAAGCRFLPATVLRGPQIFPPTSPVPPMAAGARRLKALTGAPATDAYPQPAELARARAPPAAAGPAGVDTAGRFAGGSAVDASVASAGPEGGLRADAPRGPPTAGAFPFTRVLRRFMGRGVAGGVAVRLSCSLGRRRVLGVAAGAAAARGRRRELGRRWLLALGGLLGRLHLLDRSLCGTTGGFECAAPRISVGDRPFANDSLPLQTRG